MAKLKLFVPLVFLFGFSLWGTVRGLETISARRYDFTYTVGSKMRPANFSRSIRFEGAEAARVGCAMMVLGLCGLIWLAALCWPSPRGTLVVHQVLARLASALYVISILIFLPPWRLSSVPSDLFYGVHGILFGAWGILQNIEHPDRKKQFASVAVLAFMLGVPALTITAIRLGGEIFGHDAGFAVCAALVSAIFTGAQLTLLNQKAPWML